MSPITKEFTKEQLQQIIETDHVQCGEASSLARIALASLEAEAVCVIDQSNLDYLKSGSDADVWPASRAEMGDVLLYRSAPPAPVSVPDTLADDIDSDDHPLLWSYNNGWNACRAAMTQGAEPDFREISNSSTNNCRENAEMSTKCWCLTCRPVTISDMRFVVCPECGNKRCPHANDHRNACTGSNEPGQEGSAYPAAPQQEVK